MPRAQPRERERVRARSGVYDLIDLVLRDAPFSLDPRLRTRRKTGQSSSTARRRDAWTARRHKPLHPQRLSPRSLELRACGSTTVVQNNVLASGILLQRSRASCVSLKISHTSRHDRERSSVRLGSPLAPHRERSGRTTRRTSGCRFDEVHHRPGPPSRHRRRRAADEAPERSLGLECRGRGRARVISPPDLGLHVAPQREHSVSRGRRMAETFRQYSAQGVLSTATRAERRDVQCFQEGNRGACLARKTSGPSDGHLSLKTAWSRLDCRNRQPAPASPTVPSE